MVTHRLKWLTANREKGEPRKRAARNPPDEHANRPVTLRRNSADPTAHPHGEVGDASADYVVCP